MTAKELYEVDSEFRSMIDLWVQNRRCPLIAADKLRECGLDGQAQCADWCSWEMTKQQYVGDGQEFKCGPFPSVGQEKSNTTVPDGKWYWFAFDLRGYDDEDVSHANVIPTALAKYVQVVFQSEWYSNGYHNTVEDALLSLLDGYAAALAAGVEVPTATVGQLTEVR